jgi:hypothetical protein
MSLVATAGMSQTASPLDALTVPTANLPDGCRLRSFDQPTGTETDGSAPARSARIGRFPTNPWLGTDRRFVIDVRTMIDGVPRWPDAPPPDAAQLRALEGQWVRHVLDAYHAEYLSASGGSAFVSAIRFDDPALAAGTRRQSGRFVIGATVAVVSGKADDPCRQALERHVRALK